MKKVRHRASNNMAIGVPSPRYKALRRLSLVQQSNRSNGQKTF